MFFFQVCFFWFKSDVSQVFIIRIAHLQISKPLILNLYKKCALPKNTFAHFGKNTRRSCAWSPPFSIRSCYPTLHWWFPLLVGYQHLAYPCVVVSCVGGMAGHLITFKNELRAFHFEKLIPRSTEGFLSCILQHLIACTQDAWLSMCITQIVQVLVNCFVWLR